MALDVSIRDSAAVPRADAPAGCAFTRLLRLNDASDREPTSETAALIVWRQVDLTGKTIRRLKGTRIILRNGVGFESLDIEAAARRGIPVANVPDCGADEVADHAMALRLAPKSATAAAVRRYWRQLARLSQS